MQSRHHLASNSRVRAPILKQYPASCDSSKRPKRFQRREIATLLGLGVLLPTPSHAAQLSEDAITKADAINRITKLFFKQKFDSLEELTVEDAFVYVQGPEAVAYAGKYTGRDCVRQFWAKFTKSFTVRSVPEVYSYINQSGSVFVAFDIVLENAQQPNNEFQTSMAMKVKVNDDLKLTKIALISDTLAAYLALQN